MRLEERRRLLRNLALHCAYHVNHLRARHAKAHEEGNGARADAKVDVSPCVRDIELQLAYEHVGKDLAEPRGLCNPIVELLALIGLMIAKVAQQLKDGIKRCAVRVPCAAERLPLALLGFAWQRRCFPALEECGRRRRLEVFVHPAAVRGGCADRAVVNRHKAAASARDADAERAHRAYCAGALGTWASQWSTSAET